MSVEAGPGAVLLADDLHKLAGARARARADGRSVVLVPTMGALHEGHRSLIRQARELGDVVFVSIFVNPLQFGPNEDLDRYPRTLEADLVACAQAGAEVVFVPTQSMIYPTTPEVTVSSGRMGAIVEGACRPGHFDGMLTIVMKLFNIISPDVAVFGEKDAQQLALIRRMVADLAMPVRVVGCPTVREPDGLALSSRNRFLSPDERATGLALSRALRAGAALAQAGPREVVRAARAVLDEAVKLDPPLDLDYLVLVDQDTFTEATRDYAGTAVLAVAGRVGTTTTVERAELLGRGVGHGRPRYRSPRHRPEPRSGVRS